MDEEKKTATFEVEKFSFNGIEQNVKVVRVVDGDTCYALIYALFGDFDSFGRVLVTLKKEKSSQKSFSEVLKDYGYIKDQREKARPIHR